MKTKFGSPVSTSNLFDVLTGEKFSPMGAIPTAVNLTTYAGGAEDFMSTPLQSFVEAVEAGQTELRLGPVFGLDQIAEAHKTMEENRAQGKIVIVT